MNSNRRHRDGTDGEPTSAPGLKEADPSHDTDAGDAGKVPAEEGSSVAEQVNNGKVPDPPGIP